ncbi:MAG: histidine phosphatase family protein [Anaerolineales bacterium]|nr:histidine phosphatase family protein [Anaerolineales bacterium]
MESGNIKFTRLFLIRHGETDWNVEGRYQGQADPPLNQRGHYQACELGEQLIAVDLDVLYTSPLLRSAQTAEIIAEKLAIPVYQDARLMEIHQGDWQTRLRSEIVQIYPNLFKRWETEPWNVTPPSGESLEQVQQRVYSAIDDILQNHTEQRIGIVTHRIPIALIKMRYQGLDPDVVRSLQLSNVHCEEIIVKHDG